MKMETWPGEHINTSCERAIKLASENNCVVTFEFNGVDMVATPKSQVGELNEFFASEMNRKHEEWKASDAGKKYEAERLENIAKHQAIIDGLMEQLPLAIGAGLSPVLNWLESYTQSADWNGVYSHREYVSTALKSAGYTLNSGIGSPPAFLASHSEAMGRYIVGQALDCMDHGMPPHPMLVTFVEKYRKALAIE